MKFILANSIPACRQAVTASTLWTLSSSETAHLRPVPERRSQIEIPPICGNPEHIILSDVILPLHILCLRCLLLLRLRGDKWLATMLFFLIAFDFRPCIPVTAVNDKLYMLHQESKTRAAEHSNRLGTASMSNSTSSSFRACWAGLGKGSYLEQALLFVAAPSSRSKFTNRSVFSIARDVMAKAYGITGKLLFVCLIFTSRRPTSSLLHGSPWFLKNSPRKSSLQILCNSLSGNVGHATSPVHLPDYIAT